MSWAPIIVGVAAVVAWVALLIWSVKYAGKKGEERGRLGKSAETLAEQEKRRSKMETKLAEPLEGSARDAWDRMRSRHERMRREAGSK